jgi:hypothetical protein
MSRCMVFAAGLCTLALIALPESPAWPQEPAAPNSQPLAQAKKRPVALAVGWFSRHQFPDGHWSLKDYSTLCKDKTCTGAAKEDDPVMATSLGLLTLTFANQVQGREGPFESNARRALDWLMKQQKADGDLSAGSKQQMCSHAIATWALCDDYRQSQDPKVGAAAQKAVKLIEAAQNRGTGGWGPRPGDAGDTGVFGWQIEALYAAKMEELKVDPDVLDRARKWLRSVHHNDSNGDPGLFSRTPTDKPTPVMTAIGMLCGHWLRITESDRSAVGGQKYLLANPPDEKHRDSLYLFFGTYAIHDLADHNWDTWNRAMRRTLVISQCKEGCAAGSWDPEKPSRDESADGGRLMTSALSTLTLEVYSRYGSSLPLYHLDP